MLENMRAAFRGIWSHKLRSFLTMLGVIIGIAAIIAIVSTIKGTNEQIKENLLGAGNNNVKVSLKQGDYDFYFGWETPKGVLPITEEIMEEVRAVEHVADATFYNIRNYEGNIAAGSKTIDGATICGIDSHYLNTCGYEVYQGRPFVQADFDRIHKVLLLDATATESLFPEGGAVGGIVEIKGEPFEVIGLYQREDDYKPVINSLSDYEMYMQEGTGTLLLPDSCWPIVYAFDEPKNCAARADKTDNMSTVGKAIEGVMAQLINGADDLSYKADDLLAQARNQQELASSTNRMMALVASIALLVGGIGVMNIMLVSVTERTSEIGLKKALGAKKRRILSQFLTEAILLTGIGGVLGVAAGIALAYVISALTGTPVAISIPSIFIGVGISMLIGVVFGSFPAMQASKLNPIDALRHE